MPSLTIAVVIHDGVQALDVAGPIDVFNEANNYLADKDQYQTLLISTHLNPIRASNKMQLSADLTFEKAKGKYDILLVAGGPDLPHKKPEPGLIGWIQQAAETASICGSICTGAFILGHAGLIDSRRVTTHWQNVHELAAQFPKATVEKDAIYVRDDKLVSSAGVTAGIDLALALVSQHHGANIALKVAKRLVVVAQRQGGQSQFSPYLIAPIDSESAVARIQQYVQSNIRKDLDLESLAKLVDMSPRNLTRCFQKDAGITPHELVNRARLDNARRLLEGSDLPLKTIAFECGFKSSDRMRIVFTERLGITPTQYRSNFRNQLHVNQ